MSEYTATLNGVTIGGSSPYRWAQTPNGLGHGTITTNSLQRAGVDGVLSLGPDRLNSRLVTFEIWWAASSPAECEQLARSLAAAWTPQRAGRATLAVEIVDRPYVLFGRPRSFDLDLRYAYNGTGRARCVFEATDPRLFDAALSSITLGLTAGGGLTFPLTFPLTFGTGSDSDGSAVNAGTIAASWSASIAGPVTSPTLTLGDTGEVIEIDGVVPSGSTLVVDSESQSLLLDGSPRQSWLTLRSRWWQLAPGSSTVRYRAAAGSGSCTFSWRSSWL